MARKIFSLKKFAFFYVSYRPENFQITSKLMAVQIDVQLKAKEEMW